MPTPVRTLVALALGLLLLVPAGAVASATPTPASPSGARLASRLANVVVPADCGMPRQRLHAGRTATRYHPAEGWMTLSGHGAPILAHLRRGPALLLAQYTCTAGGVSWPAVLVAYDRSNRLVSSFDLRRVSHTEHAEVYGWSASGRTVRVRWRSYEGCCFQMRYHRSVLVLRHGHLRLR